MQRYLIRRLLQLIPTLILASILIFLIIQLAPGDPAAMMLGSEATDEQLAIERKRLGLDKPIPVRYVIWLSDVLRLNLGKSQVTSLPVTELVRMAFGNTLKLALTALGVSLLLGLSMGIVSGLRRDKAADAFITGFNAIGLAIPSFWLGIMLILIFSVNLRLLPPSGVGNPEAGFISNLKFLIMPVISIAVSNTAVFSRYMRTSLIDVLGEDYVRTAHAKGLAERFVISRHALRNAWIPVVTIIGIQFGRLLGGAVITEAVFAYSGIGRLVVFSIQNRDYPVVQGTLMLVVLIFLLTNVVVDLLYGVIDPRVRFERAES
jgi:ABC-type dipeptide/oligopeptide/nickel transport system permease component